MNRPRKSAPIGVLTKTFRLLEDVQSAPASLTELSLHTGINKSTALRILAHLEREGYVFRDTRGAYHTGTALLRLGVRSSLEVHLREAAQAPMRELWRITQETVNLGLLDGLEVLYLDSLESPQSFRLVANVGTRAVAYRTALGKAILAFTPPPDREASLAAFQFHAFTPRTITTRAQLEAELASVETQGYAIDDEESVLGVRCLAAPIFDTAHAVVAGISISGPTSRITAKRIPEFAAALRAAAAQISPDRALVHHR